jgi:hypothetical protein
MPPDSSQIDAETTKVCKTLEAIAAQYPADSVEALAIRDAALAYALVSMRRGLKNSYDKLRASVGGALTEEMKDNLRRHGIDPDELESEEAF